MENHEDMIVVLRSTIEHREQQIRELQATVANLRLRNAELQEDVSNIFFGSRMREELAAMLDRIQRYLGPRSIDDSYETDLVKKDLEDLLASLPKKLR